MRKALSLGVLALAVAGLATAAPASAADTTLTVNLIGGTLSISAPTTASLSGSAAVGTVITGPLGSTATSVTDNRGTLLGWTATAVTSGDLVSTGTPTDKIALTAVGSPLTVLTGTIASSGGLLTGVSAGAGGSLSTTAVTLATAALGSGGATYTYTPTLTLTVPANTKAHNDYTTTITQSVA